MAAIAGIWNTATAQGAASITASRADASGSTGGDTGSSATVTANDFLTLLVTEMQNQDPTATTDPNEYVNQLVSVNSLQQLIQINQTLSSAVDPATGASPVSNSSSGIGTHLTGPVPGGQTSAGASVLPHFVGITSGNLATPATNPAAERVAQALNNRTQGT